MFYGHGVHTCWWKMLIPFNLVFWPKWPTFFQKCLTALTNFCLCPFAVRYDKKVQEVDYYFSVVLLKVHKLQLSVPKVNWETQIALVRVVFERSGLAVMMMSWSLAQIHTDINCELAYLWLPAKFVSDTGMQEFHQWWAMCSVLSAGIHLWSKNIP